ncbi:histidine phosphatase family protein [Antarctobacter sp.]|uniref:histidine phosphatase family protein n=1 Tax=Antarctobacter sp. TaxID=1872577 RepID=UPI002B274BA3|nr:histidine phosphatase family protein [Antarctobacter sp.]
MSRLLFITHPEVTIEPDCPIPDWSLSAVGTRRALAFAAAAAFADVTHIWSSNEAKARQTAALLAKPSQLSVSVDSGLAENDRSATGFLPPEAFERAANRFFAAPDESYLGWERACDAQSRIVAAVGKIVAEHKGGDLAIVSHGAVGTLLYCSLCNLPIDRAYDQPSQGYYWTSDLPSLKPRHGWRSIG